MYKKLWSLLCLVFISWTLASCSDTIESVQAFNTESKPPLPKVEKIKEVAPPSLIQQLSKSFDQYQPQVKILSPQNDQILQDTTVKVELQVKDLPIFKNQQLGLGPHLHFFIDNNPYKAVYSVDEPVVLENLAPGTHTIRVFASRPWHESFKNEGAYAQTTFHVFTPSDDNNPDINQPLLTYSRPEGTYGAQPIMLDFYLTKAPLHLVAQEDSQDEINDWRIRVTINGENFLLDTWQPIYLQGFNEGQNWLKLEFIDENGDVVKNVFNSSARVINLDSQQKDTLSRLVKGEISLEEARVIVEANYTPQVISEEKTISEVKEETKLEITEEVTPEVKEEVIPEVKEEITPEKPLSSDNTEIQEEINTEEVKASKVIPENNVINEEKTTEIETPINENF